MGVLHGVEDDDSVLLGPGVTQRGEDAGDGGLGGVGGVEGGSETGEAGVAGVGGPLAEARCAGAVWVDPYRVLEGRVGVRRRKTGAGITVIEGGRIRRR